MQGQKGFKVQQEKRSHYLFKETSRTSPGICFSFLFFLSFFFFLRRNETILFAHDVTIFLRFYLFVFREKGKGGEREGEKYQSVASCTPPTRDDLAHHPGMCPDQESNP